MAPAVVLCAPGGLVRAGNTNSTSIVTSSLGGPIWAWYRNNLLTIYNGNTMGSNSTVTGIRLKT